MTKQNEPSGTATRGLTAEKGVMLNVTHTGDSVNSLEDAHHIALLISRGVV